MGTSGEAAGTVTGQVADYDGPAGTLEAVTGPTKTPELGTGSISADGTFEFRFEGSPTSVASSPILPPGTCPDIEVSDSDARGVNVAVFNVVSEGSVRGTLSQSQGEAGSVAGVALPAVLVSRVYADRNVTVEGTCNVSALGTEVSTTYDVAYQQGWNTIVTRTSAGADGSLKSVTTLATSSDLEGVAWSY